MRERGISFANSGAAFQGGLKEVRTHIRTSLLMLAVLIAGTASAMVREVSFPELTRLSETTMEVVVVNSYAEWNAEHTAIFTHYVVEPLRQVGGSDRGVRFELLFAGGRASDGKQMIVTEVPSLEVGGQYILFLHPRETRHAAPTVGMWQGSLRVVRDPQTKRTVLVDANGQVIERDGSGGLHRGRHVNVDEHGFLTAAAAIESEPGMESDPVLRDPEGRVLPLRKELVEQSLAAPAIDREAIDADTFMNMIDHIRRQQTRESK